ncbi:hypothetical protein AaE_012047 [Aphanomyces astaci]|uniref:Uncharacterized protein n=1 Tax=Aphanomyces astaci TaxID=112090 RepID=A0A6A4ZE88_APHAT|nr:hypothetical protein AaE_012047 [Aphanomyces astaci]
MTAAQWIDETEVTCVGVTWPITGSLALQVSNNGIDFDSNTLHIPVVDKPQIHAVSPSQGPPNTVLHIQWTLDPAFNLTQVACLLQQPTVDGVVAASTTTSWVPSPR